MGNRLQIQGSLLARNTLLNLLGHIVPLLAGLATIPYIVRGLGSEGFGILSIAWVLLGYFSLFDLGLGRATTKFVAECLGRGEMNRLPGLVWTSVGFQLLLGVGGGVLAAVFVPALVDRVLTVSPSFVHEAKVSFLLLALSLPVVLASATFRSVLESGQRFDLVNYVKVPANTSVFLLPALAVALRLHLPGIIILLLLSRVVATLAYLVLCLKVFPNLRERFPFDPGVLRPLLSYGGWVTVSNVVSPILVSVDRFVIGALLSMAAVTYYAAPSEMVSRLSVFPASLILTLFPAFSSFDAGGAKDRIEKLYACSIKFLLLTLGPALAVLIILARDILRLWLGSGFSAKSTVVLQILAAGVFFNSLALMPLTLIHGLGRPDVVAKFHLLELPLYTAVLWVLVTHMGIQGAALAWTLRMAVDALLLFGAAGWLKFASLPSLLANGILRSLGAVLLFGALLSFPLREGSTLLTKTMLSALMLLAFAAGSWSFLLDEAERGFLARSAGRVLATFRGHSDERTISVKTGGDL